MRFRLFLCFVVLLPQLSLLAQNSDFPTLEALAKVELPAFDYVDVVDRMSPMDVRHVPPASPPAYSVGDRETFRLSYQNGGSLRPTEMELRRMTQRVLIWVESTVDYPIWRANALAQSLERNVLNPMQELFDFAEPPGVDGDSRLIVAMIRGPEHSSRGYFQRLHARPTRLEPYSNGREMLVINVKEDEDYDFFDKILIGTVAHEYLHVLHYHKDSGEESWLDEALAMFAGFRASKPFLSRSTGQISADIFLEKPNTGLTQWYAVEDTGPKYGASFLFIMYLAQRFGDDIAARLLAEPANGWQSIIKVLREFTDTSVDEIIADWVVANYFLDARRGYGYRELDADLTPPSPAASLNSFPATHEGELPQYATEYLALDVRGADKLLLRLRQAPVAKLFDAYTGETASFAYAVSSEHSNPRLTRAFNLATSRHVWLEFRFWFDLDEDNEYLYVTISTDKGESWQTLRGKYTERSEVYDQFFTVGYTGKLRSWRNERIDLSRYAPGEVLISFELVSEYGTSYSGAAIDDVYIRTINYNEYFDSFDDGWTADGWIITDNRLPNNTWLQVGQDTGDRLHVSRELLTGSGELKIDLLPGVSNALVAVSPVVPRTGLPTEYQLEVNLLNAAGDVLQISRECTVTTTHALNFRAAPNGSKIGLLLKGTAVDALDRRGDWFQVNHNGSLGWVHGDYVTEAGNCP